MRAGALALAALLLVPLVPFASAAPPTPTAWSPYDATQTMTAVALSADGSTAAAALGAPIQAPAPAVPGTGTPSVSNRDLAIFDTLSGFATNGSGGATPLGRSDVAVSTDGSSIASLGVNRTAADPLSGILGGSPGQQLQLYYQHITPGKRWAGDSPAVNLTRVLAGNASMVAISPDGMRIVAASNTDTQFTVYGFRFDGTQLLSQFTFNQSGHVYDVATTADLERIAIATQIPETNNESHAALWSLSFATGQLMGTLYDRSANGSAFLSAGVTPDGRLLAGDKAGRLLYADHTNEFQAILLPGVGGNVTPLTVSADGTRAALVVGSQLAALDLSGRPTIIWNTTVNGTVEDLKLNRTGGTIVAAVNGTDGGVLAYGDNDATLLWKVPGNAHAVAIDSEGNTVAYAQRSVLTVAKVTRSIVFEFAGGLKSTAPRPVKPLGSTTFEVNVRNPGAALERVIFVGPRDTDVTITPDTSILAVAPGESKKVLLTATAGRSFGGRHSFNVSAVGISSGVIDNVTLSLTLQTSTNVTLALNGSSELTVAAGVRTDILLGVRNNGSRDVAIGMRALQQSSDGGAWNVVLDPATFTLAPNTITSVRASVTAPERTPNGTSNTVTFIMEGPDVADQATVTFRINPTLGVDINAAGRVKFVEPGKIGWYNVTVTNTGSLPRQFQAFFQATPSGGKNWQVDMDTTTFPLDPLQSRTIPVKIYAPQSATPNDRVSVFIVARTIPELVGENVTQANLTLFANAIPLVPTTTTPTTSVIPGPGMMVVIVSVTMLSFVLRRWRRDH